MFYPRKQRPLELESHGRKEPAVAHQLIPANSNY
jgi:hypothetical protein